jgi:hypothetical protein
MNLDFHNANLSIEIPPGDAGIMATLWIMRAAIDDAVESGGPASRLATTIAATSGRNTDEQLAALYRFMMDHIVFKRDPWAMENVRHPDQIASELLQAGQTSCDCDCTATLGATLLRCMGIPPALIVVSTRPGGQFHHVLFGGYVRGRLITLDPQERMFNTLPDTVTRKLVFEVTP